MRHLRVPLRVVFYKDGQDWVAHCLEFDLVGEGVDKAAALHRLAEAITLQVEASVKYHNWQNLFKPADGRFFAMFAAGVDDKVGVIDREFDDLVIENVETREYREPSEQGEKVAS